MRTRTRNGLLLAVIGIAAVGGAFFAAQKPSLRSSVLRAVPAQAFVVVTIDAKMVRKSALASLWRAAIDRVDTKIPGQGANTPCDKGLFDRISDAVFVVPEHGENGEFGVAAQLALTRKELVSCAKQLDVGATTGEQIGGFSVIGGAGPGPKLAFRQDGIALYGARPVIVAMIDAAEGRAPRFDAEEVSRQAREILLISPAIVATVRLPAELRGRLKGEFAAVRRNSAEVAARDQGDASTPKRAIGEEAVLDVSEATLGVAFGEAGQPQPTHIVAKLTCEAAESCGNVKRLIEQKRFALSQDLAARIFGFGPLIDSLVVEQRAGELIVSADLPAEATAEIAQRLLQAASTGAPTITSADPIRHPSPGNPAPIAR